MKYLYNGIELPKLPETTEEKPNGFIIVYHATGEPIYYARYSSLEKEANVDGSVVLISYDYVLQDGSWISGTGAAAGTIIWANYDVYYADDVEEVGGTLYLAASEPVPVLEIQIPKCVDRYSYIVGFNLALAGMAYPYSAPTPVAYLYNGIRLPALPEWDRGMYPYAYITRYRYSPLYSLYVAASPVSVLYIGSIINNGGDINQFYYGALSDELKDWRDWGLEWPDSGEEITVWSNSDVYYADDVSDVGGTIYLSASDPVPVYE